jgi:tetratricopeptide repeat protein
MTRLLGLALLVGPHLGLQAREPEPRFAQVTIHAAHEGCQVDLDAQAVGKTQASGNLILLEVEPGDHYLHLRCAGEGEVGFFVSPRAGDHVVLPEPRPSTEPLATVAGSPEIAQVKIQLRSLTQEAAQLRARGQLDQAVAKIREALKLDPENSDLHRELGITFLLGKEWKRARVEMIEAIRHDPTDADAYNGLGYALEKLGDLAGALKDYRLATRLDPDDPTYRTHYFDALSKFQTEKNSKKK